MCRRVCRTVFEAHSQDPGKGAGVLRVLLRDALLGRLLLLGQGLGLAGTAPPEAPGWNRRNC